MDIPTSHNASRHNPGSIIFRIDRRNNVMVIHTNSTDIKTKECGERMKWFTKEAQILIGKMFASSKEDEIELYLHRSGKLTVSITHKVKKKCVGKE